MNQRNALVICGCKRVDEEASKLLMVKSHSNCRDNTDGKFLVHVLAKECHEFS